MMGIVSLDDALGAIKDGDTVASTGVLGWLTPDSLLKGIRQRYLDGVGAKGLSFYFPVSVGDAMSIGGMEHVALPGLMKRVVSGNYINPVNPETGERSELVRLIRENQVEAYAWPIGAAVHWLREVARGGPGYFTDVGIGAFIDPRHSGGKLNERTTEDLVKVRNVEGKEYLFYPTWKLDVALIRATCADRAGNLSLDEEPIHSVAVALAIAVKSCGGKVIAQVKRIVKNGEIPASRMQIPGNLVDYVVVEPDSVMATDVGYDPRYLGGVYDSSSFTAVPFGVEKLIARRAARELKEGEVSIFGFGYATGIPLVMIEDGLLDGDRFSRYVFTTEHGPHGGIVMSGYQFSANLYPQALLDGAYQFDFIDGGNCGFAGLSFAEFDAQSNINVSRFGGNIAGSGGFLDIATKTPKLVFCGSFTTGGLDVRAGDGRLDIVREGKVRKFVGKVQEVTYPLGQGVRERDQVAIIVTERAIFDVTQDGLVLKEIAPGVDLQKDIIGQMDFKPIVTEDLRTMDAELFKA